MQLTSGASAEHGAAQSATVPSEHASATVSPGPHRASKMPEVRTCATGCDARGYQPGVPEAGAPGRAEPTCSPVSQTAAASKKYSTPVRCCWSTSVYVPTANEAPPSAGRDEAQQASTSSVHVASCRACCAVLMALSQRAAQLQARLAQQQQQQSRKGRDCTAYANGAPARRVGRRAFGGRRPERRHPVSGLQPLDSSRGARERGAVAHGGAVPAPAAVQCVLPRWQGRGQGAG